VTNYRVSASIRNKHGKELRSIRTLWQGDAADPKQAIVSAHQALGPLLKGEPMADTIVLHIHDPKGSITTTTEYAEDFLICPGASIGKTGLMDANADHGLSEEQIEAAKKALESTAVATVLPDAAEQARQFHEAMKPFLPDADAADLVFPGISGGEVEGAVIYVDENGDLCRRRKSAPLVQGTMRKTFESPEHQTMIHDLRSSDAIRDPVRTIGEGLADLQANNAQPRTIRVSPEIFSSLVDGTLVRKDPANPNGFGRFHGVHIEVGRELHPDQIQYILPSVRSHTPRRSGGHIFDKLAREIMRGNINPFI